MSREPLKDYWKDRYRVPFYGNTWGDYWNPPQTLWGKSWKDEYHGMSCDSDDTKEIKKAWDIIKKDTDSNIGDVVEMKDKNREDSICDTCKHYVSEDECAVFKYSTPRGTNKNTTCGIHEEKVMPTCATCALYRKNSGYVGLVCSSLAKEIGYPLNLDGDDLCNGPDTSWVSQEEFDAWKKEKEKDKEEPTCDNCGFNDTLFSGDCKEAIENVGLTYDGYCTFSGNDNGRTNMGYWKSEDEVKILMKEKKEEPITREWLEETIGGYLNSNNWEEEDVTNEDIMDEIKPIYNTMKDVLKANQTMLDSIKYIKMNMQMPGDIKSLEELIERFNVKRSNQVNDLKIEMDNNGKADIKLLMRTEKNIREHLSNMGLGLQQQAMATRDDIKMLHDNPRPTVTSPIMENIELFIHVLGKMKKFRNYDDMTIKQAKKLDKLIEDIAKKRRIIRNADMFMG